MLKIFYSNILVFLSIVSFKFKNIKNSLIKILKNVDSKKVNLTFYFKDDRRGTLRVIDVELIDDLVDTCMPGADVVVTGIVKVCYLIFHKLYIKSILLSFILIPFNLLTTYFRVLRMKQ